MIGLTDTTGTTPSDWLERAADCDRQAPFQAISAAGPDIGGRTECYSGEVTVKLRNFRRDTTPST